MEKGLTFDKNGYLLPYDVVPVNWNTVEETLGNSLVRQQLLEDYRQFIVTMRNILPVAHKHWIDGSFVSQRELPGDIDVIVFVPNVYFAKIANELTHLKKKWAGRIDCYFVEIFSPDHSKFDVGRADELTWYHFLRMDRRNRPKGILELTIGYGNQG